MPTALTLEVLMRVLQERSDRKLAELTGLDQAVVSRCKKLLSYPKRYQDMMLDPDPSRRVKADFFIELYPVKTDRVVRKMDWFSPNPFTDRMLEKYRAHAGLKAVTDFRVLKQHISNARRAHKVRTIEKRLKEFTEDDTLSIDHLVIQSASVSAQARKLTASVEQLLDALRQLSVEEFYGEEGLWKALERLLEVIRAKLLEADRRLKR